MARDYYKCDNCGRFTNEREGRFTECGTAWVCPTCEMELDSMDCEFKERKNENQ